MTTFHELVLSEKCLRPSEKTLVLYIAAVGSTSLTQRELARRLCISHKTVEKAMSRLQAMCVVGKSEEPRTSYWLRATSEWRLMSPDSSLNRGVG